MISRLIIRFFDLVLSLTGSLLLLPAFLIIGIWIKLDSAGAVFYRQHRVGKDGADFKLLKFRTMHAGADRKGLITVGERDPRVTNAGFYLRKFKLDELPQLFNVLAGQMSLVGPRPEVRKYVDLYSPEQQVVLKVKPGITDEASVVYSNENELLSASKDPERYYIDVVMPDKIKLNLRFINDPSVANYFRIIFRTIKKILAG